MVFIQAASFFFSRLSFFFFFLLLPRLLPVAEALSSLPKSSELSFDEGELEFEEEGVGGSGSRS